MWVWTLGAALCICLTALAQNQPAPQARTPATLVLPVPGAPLSAETVEEHVIKLPDGTSKTEVLTNKVFRDIEGRVRTENEIEGAQIVTIANMPDGFVVLLIPSQRMGGRMSVPEDKKAGMAITFLTNPVYSKPGKKSEKTELLGKQTIEGIECQGRRNTITLDEEPSIVGVDEQWTNTDLGLYLLLKTTAPDEQSSAKLIHIDRRAPDPALFQIPADYVVQDLRDDHPPR